MTLLSRRQTIMATAAFAFAPAILKQPAHARADLQGAGAPVFNRFRLGSFEVTTLLAGSRVNDTPREIFGLNAKDEDFLAASAAAFIPADKTQFFFTPTVVNTGTELVLFDTGLSAEGTGAAMAAAGLSADQVDVVVLTHMHGDHIGGLMGADGMTPSYPNARYVTGATEHNHWSAAADEGFDKAVKPLNDKMTFLDDGGSVAGGITGLMAAGHTPGHMAYMIESDGQRLALTADAANHYVWSLQFPDWEVRFDADKPAAAATRKSLFGMIAADRIPFIGYHMPFPALGFVEPKDAGFRFVPASYQLMLNG